MSVKYSKCRNDDLLVNLAEDVTNCRSREPTGSWPTLCFPADNAVSERNDHNETRTSPWYDRKQTSPMITHCHLVSVSPENTVRRIRSRSLPDTCNMLNHDLPSLEEETRFSSSPSLNSQSPASEDGGKDSDALLAPATSEGNPVWISIMYGLINASIVLPVLMSFGSIIYRDEAFSPYMPVLIKRKLTRS